MSIASKVAAGLGIALMLFASQVRASEKAELIEELFSLSGFEQMAQIYMSDYAKAMVASWKVTLQNPDDAALSALESEFASRLVKDYLSLKPVIADLYRDTFTKEELSEILAFYKSPAGKAFLKKIRKIDEKISKVFYPESLKQAEKHWYDSVNLLRKRGMKL